MLRCAHAMYHYIAFCAGFQAGFFIISCLAAKWLEFGGEIFFYGVDITKKKVPATHPARSPAAHTATKACRNFKCLRRQLHIGNGMGLGTEAESPNVRWGSGGKDGSLR